MSMPEETPADVMIRSCRTTRRPDARQGWHRRKGRATKSTEKIPRLFLGGWSCQPRAIAAPSGRWVPHLNRQRTAPACPHCRPRGLTDDKAVYRHRMLGEPDRVEAKTQLPRDPKARAIEQSPDVRYRDTSRQARMQR